MIIRPFCAFTNTFSQLFTTGVSEHQSNVTCFDLNKVSSDVHTGCGYIGKKWPSTHPYIYIYSIIMYYISFFHVLFILLSKELRTTIAHQIMKNAEPIWTNLIYPDANSFWLLIWKLTNYFRVTCLLAVKSERCNNSWNNVMPT